MDAEIIPGSWLTWQAAILLLVGGAVAMTALKIVWGVAQWRYKSPHRLGDQMAATRRAFVTEWSEGCGYVDADGERWRATSTENLAAGDPVRIVRVDGLNLLVKKAR